MSGLGSLLLASKGKENEILNINPTITFFKKVYKAHSNISNEVLPQFFKSMSNFGRRMTVNISKNGDMLSDMTLYFELPEIPVSNHSTLPYGIKQFAWAKKTGLAMIKYIDIEIGGTLISRHYSDWLNIYNEMNVSKSQNKKIGVTEEMTTYSNGKISNKLYIPLSFFFNSIKVKALPLIALSHQDVKLHLELNDFTSCYKESPTNYFTIDTFICLYRKGEYIRQNVDGLKSIGIFVYFDINTKRVYYDSVYNTFLTSTTTNAKIQSKYNIIGDISQFSIYPSINSIIVKDESYFNAAYPVLKNTYILANYIYLDSNEKWYFINTELSYVVPIILNVLEKDITSINSNYKLQLINPHTTLIWRAQLNNNILINDQFNYSSLPLTLNDEPLIYNNKLIINSIPRCELANYQYYTHMQNYICNFISCDNIYMYSFGLDTSTNNMKGTINFSMIDDIYIMLNLNKLVNYQNIINIKAYGLYYNLFIIKNGNSSIKYYI